MSKLLVVFGATGQQGGSVIDYVLQDDELKTQFKLRGISRNATGAAAKSLEAKGVEVVQADPEKPETLENALQGAHTVFSNTVSVYDERLYEREVSTGKAIADASVAAGAQYIIYSSSTPAGKITGRPVIAFDSKVEVEDYIKTLPIKSAFYAAGSFMQNWHGQQKPHPTGKPGEYAIYNLIDVERKIPVIEISADTGKFVGAILANPEKYEGKSFYAASELLTLPEVAETISAATGKTVRYVYLPEEQWSKFLPEPMREALCAMMQYMNHPGYYGPDTNEKVRWTAEQARGKLTTYAEFLKNNPMQLD